MSTLVPSKKFARTLLGLALAIALMVVFLGLHSINIGRKAAEQNARMHTQNLAESINQNISSAFREIDHALLSVKDEIEADLAVKKLNLPHLKRVITFHEKKLASIDAIRVTDADGRMILSSTSDEPNAKISDRLFFSSLRDNPGAGVFITKPFVGKFSQKWLIISARRYDFPDGRFAGVIAVPFFLEHFQKILSKFDVGASGILTLRDDEGGVVTRHPSVVKGITLPVGDKTLSHGFIASVRSGVTRKTYSALTPFDHTWRMLTLQRIEGTAFYIVASLAEEDYLAQWKKDRAITLTLVLAFLVAGGIISRLLWLSWQRREHNALTLRENAERLQSILQTSMDGFYSVDMQGHLLEVNETYCKMSGYREQELCGLSISDLEVVESASEIAACMRGIMEKGQDRFETRHRRKDGSIFDVEVSVRYWPTEGGRIISFLRDITLRKQAEEKISQSLKEKEILLREIHHRVKNNMAVVSSLISLQASQIEDGTFKTLFQETQQRVRSMALIHEKLYQTKDFSNIDFEDYVRTLIFEIINVHRVDIRNITMEICIEDIKLDLQSAMPCGLIINELLSNVFKYAFPDNRKGVLKINFTKIDNSHTLSIKDNGVGLPEGHNLQDGKTLGLQLVNALVGQLQGKFQLKHDQGVEAILTFKIANA